MGKDKPQIILFGDSITEFSYQLENAGWGAALTNYYARKADVVMRGFGGYNSRLALYLLDSIFPIDNLRYNENDNKLWKQLHHRGIVQNVVAMISRDGPLVSCTQSNSSVLFTSALAQQPLLVTVFFGANDSCIPNLSQGHLSVPLAEYGENLKKIIAHLKKMSDSTLIVLITPPPIDEKEFLITCEKFDWLAETNGVCPRTNEQVKLYADECVKVSQEIGVPVIDLWSTFMEAPDWTKYLCDGLHLSVQGNTRLFEELLKVVEEPSLVPTLKADQMPIDFTHFIDFGPDPLASLKNHIANL